MQIAAGGQVRVAVRRSALVGFRQLRLDRPEFGDLRHLLKPVVLGEGESRALRCRAAAYLKMRRQLAGAAAEADKEDDGESGGGNADAPLDQATFDRMHAAEAVILTITENGLGKLSSSHDYPVRGRGGFGVRAADKDMRGGRLVACFPVEMQDEIMLVTSEGQSIRMPVAGISFRSRSAGGVNVFNVEEDQYVVSVAHIPAGDMGGEGDEDGEGADPDAAPVGPAEEAGEAADGA